MWLECFRINYNRKIFSKRMIKNIKILAFAIILLLSGLKAVGFGQKVVNPRNNKKEQTSVYPLNEDSALRDKSVTLVNTQKVDQNVENTFQIGDSLRGFMSRIDSILATGVESALSKDTAFAYLVSYVEESLRLQQYRSWSKSKTAKVNSIIWSIMLLTSILGILLNRGSPLLFNIFGIMEASVL